MQGDDYEIISLSSCIIKLFGSNLQAHWYLVRQVRPKAMVREFNNGQLSQESCADYTTGRVSLKLFITISKSHCSCIFNYIFNKNFLHLFIHSLFSEVVLIPHCSPSDSFPSVPSQNQFSHSQSNVVVS